MATASKALFSLTAADLMSASLLFIPEEMSLKGAAHQLTQASVTGAPVVNRAGHCVGVLSATDFVHWIDRDEHGVAACAASPAFCASWQLVDPEQLPDVTVRDYMTRDPVMVPTTTRLGELARKMLDVHIHRVIVVDYKNKPIGIVSSTDILAAVVRADQLRNPAEREPKESETVACLT